MLMVYNFSRVCRSVCQTTTFESLPWRTKFMLHIPYISREHRSSSYMKVIGSR